MATPSRAHTDKARRVLEALVAVHKDAAQRGLKKGAGGTGSLPCPNQCGGTVAYSVNGSNGHTMGRCSTKGCAAWIE